MSGLYYQPSLPVLPAFLGGPAPVAPVMAPPYAAPAYQMGGETWAASQTYEMASLQQELGRIQQQLDQLLAGLTWPSPQPVIDWFGQAWQNVSNYFTPAPPPAPPPPMPQPPVPQPPAGPGPSGPTRFVLSSFNVLSSSAGKGKGYAPGTERIRDVAQILKNNNVSVVGFQEMDANQLKMFKQIAGDQYGTFAGSSGIRGYHDTTIAWRKDTWKLEQSGHITVPSYAGRDSKVPYVRLRNKQTGQEAYFVDAHNPANTKKYHHQERFRDAAARMEADLVDRLIRQTGLPVFLVGDMNSVREAQAIITKGAPVKAANPPGKAGIDWIFGSRDVKFSGFRRERGGLIARTTDHPVVFSDVKIGGK